MAAVARLDDVAFLVLYERHAATVMGFATYLARPPLRAEDIVQEAFLTVWRSAGRYDPERGTVRPWLLGIVRGRAIDGIRRVRARRESTGDPDDALNGLESGVLPEAQVLRGESARAVRDALDRLPVEQRTVVVLAYFQGFTHAEIADRLSVPVTTVKGRMRLALLKLRELLDGWIETAR